MPPRKQQTIGSDVEAWRLLGEKLRANALKPNIYGYFPHAKQEIFHKAISKTRLYIGGNRSGKTTGGIVEDIWWLTGKHPYRPTPPPPVRGRVVSVDFKNGVEKIIIPEFTRWMPVSEYRGGSWSTAYDRETNTLHLENGSFVEFMSYDQDLDKFAGTSRHFIHFDEEPPEIIYTENMARLIDTGGSHWFTMTPVEGMTWIYDTVYEPGKRGEHGIVVIEVDMTENPYLGEAEIQEFIGRLSDDEKLARVKGQFVQLGGLIYKTFNPTPGGPHVLQNFFMPPKDWIWVVSLDAGFNNPTAVLWHAIDPDGRTYTWHEHYQSGWTVDKHAAEIHRLNKEFGRGPDYYVADPSIKNRDPITGTSIHQEYVKFGIPFILGNNDVAAGLQKVNRFLQLRDDGAPLWRVNRSCSNLIKEMLRYRWRTYSSRKVASESNPQEVPHKKNDHACDALRYFIMSRPDMTSDYAARQDYVSNEFKDILAVPLAVGDDRKADPWHRSGDLPGEYIKLSDNSSWEISELGGIV